ncbi:hypothetical protein GALMADRAFT_222029 [Galerina marginata CBS 339.88]|uniref:Terpene synthase n=1 Tax=Galerina marginata (strain CBS 339.88) TaxID=685588 RepID=A0A067TG08_GALM3|nr:hypothetical protein GALMADRAFT_222029 [Galerina marginata CBS 339.88]
MFLNFVIDEYTDVTDSNGANNIRQIVMDVLLNSDKERPDGEHVIGVMFKDFWMRASGYVSPGADCLKRFTDDFNDYTAAVVKEAKIRTQRRYSNFEDYLKLRLYTIGCFTTYTLCEFGLDLPEAVLSHPRMIDLREKAAILTGITNDIYSFPMEKSRGGGLELHNSVELVMAEQNLDVQAAINWLERYLAGVVAAFLEDIDQMPSWGKEVDQRVKICINAIAQATRGIDDWCFECGRYFGRKGLEIQKTRVMTIMTNCVRAVPYKRNTMVVAGNAILSAFLFFAAAPSTKEQKKVR